RLPGRLAPGLDGCDVGGDDGAALLERSDLLAIEDDLLLPAVDRELAGMRGLPRARRASVGFGQLDAQAAEVAFDLRDPRRGDRVALSGVSQAAPPRLD